MKKVIALLLVAVMALSLAACQKDANPNNTTTKAPGVPTTQAPGTTANPTTPAQPVDVMSYAEYIAAEDGMAVTVEFYVQATQGWWFDNTAGHGKITIYGQTEEGGYFAYEVNCDEETGKKVVPGTKIRVSGEKATWEGEVEIMNGTLEIIEGDTWIAGYTEVTDFLGTEALLGYQNMYVSFRNLTVVACNDAGDVFQYKWNGSGSEGDDLYFNVSDGENVYTFVVESYLCGVGSDAYEAVRNLKVGDVIDLKGYLYWYNNVQPHITSVVVKMDHETYMQTEDGMLVNVEFYVQATQGWWFDNAAGHGKITIYGQTEEGGYFAYEVNCDEETGKKLVPGTKVCVSGEKATWEGEVEIMNATLEIIEGDTWIAEPVDVTELLGDEKLFVCQNMKVSFKGMTVVACNDAGDAFQYKWNGSGSEGDDLYFNVSYNGVTYTFCVESYLCGLGSDAYEAVRNLKVGDVIDLEGFLYWYNGVQPHITSVSSAN